MQSDARTESSGFDEPHGRLGELVDEIAADVGLSGAIRVDVDGRPVVERAYGMAHRGPGVTNTIDTQFAIASGAKGFTALAVMSLVESDELQLDTTARSILSDDLALIDDRVTVEHLLAHRSGTGDYLDEDDDDLDSNDYVLTVPVHELATTEQFLAVLDGHQTKFEPDERFSYCNGGFIVLSLLAERASGSPVPRSRRPARVPPGRHARHGVPAIRRAARAALGYLDDDGLRSNVLHLPVRGNGDGGIYTTAADVHALWDALLTGRIVALDAVDEMLRPRTDETELDMGYGLGFWLDDAANTVTLIGGDAGVGFVSTRHRDDRFTFTVLCNQTRGSWPVSQHLAQLVAATI